MRSKKKHGKEQKHYNDYVLIYIEVGKQARATKEVALAVHNKYTDYILEYLYICSRILAIKISIWVDKKAKTMTLNTHLKTTNQKKNKRIFTSNISSILFHNINPRLFMGTMPQLIVKLYLLLNKNSMQTF